MGWADLGIPSGKTLEKPSSILALDSTTQQILGVKLGAIASISDDDSEAPYFWLDYVDYVACLLPTSLYKALMCEKFMGWLRCDPFLAMEDLGCHKVFHGQLLCVAESARGRGLGRQLVKRSLDMAQANLCEFYFLCATGIYSQSIYQSLGFQVMKCAKYVDHRDRYGRQVIDDPGEHTHAQTMSKALYSTHVNAFTSGFGVEVDFENGFHLYLSRNTGIKAGHWELLQYSVPSHGNGGVEWPGISLVKGLWFSPPNERRLDECTHSSVPQIIMTETPLSALCILYDLDLAE
eukprot:maker-scaffold159_size295958-snap-gene-1.32 protein:Tk05087 transcript:maker-scaffold159_size295958-snap-gene-1.32-mRNA-1 annotation:"dopamine n-acetyltransferase"